MEAFATTADYRMKYGGEVEDEALEVWLEDASAVIRDELEASGADYDDAAVRYADALMRVCRDMVHRALGDGGDGFEPVPFGATQVNMTGGSYSRGYSFANPYDDLFLTAAEKRRLGIGLERACVLSPYGGN